MTSPVRSSWKRFDTSTIRENDPSGLAKTERVKTPQ